MPRGRMIDKRIGESKKLPLVSDKAKVVYFMLLPHLDKNGAFKAVGGYIKWSVMPHINYNYKQIDRCLVELDRADLLMLYKSNDENYLQYTRFRCFQTNDSAKEGSTDIPEPTPEQLQSRSRVTPEQLQTQVKVKDKGKDKEERGRFSPPSIEELKKFIKEKGYTINAITFFNHYESNGWLVGKNKMKSWQAAVANWNSRDKDEKKPLMAKKETPDYIKKMQKDYKEKIGAK